MWHQVVLVLSDPESLDQLLGELDELACGGSEVRDSETFSDFGASAFAPLAPGQLQVIAYFPEDRSAAALAALTSRPGTQVVATGEADETWLTRWRQYFAPTQVSPRLLVRPSWEAPLLREGLIELVVDPGMAFGTGTHETTRLCLEALDQWLSPDRPHAVTRMLDVGTGSGILSIAAAKLGAASVFGVDNDPDAVAVARENWALNGLGREDEAPFAATDLAALEERFDLVVANILPRTLLELRAALLERVAEGGRLLVSGVLSGGAGWFLAQFKRSDLVLEEQRDLGEWSSLRFARA